ncbi:hypothetical protein VUR80DRAFT_8498 [Thermomyces stellatus]
MERNGGEYPQPGLPSPYPPSYPDPRPEQTSAETQPTPQYPAAQPPEVRPSAYSASGTPTSDYGVYPASARSGSFPDNLQRPYQPHPASGSGSAGGMSQPNNPSIAAPSPTYPYGQHSPYGPPGDMGPGYQQGGSMYAQPRPDWSAYGQHGAAPMTPTGPVFPPTPTSAGSQQQRANQVFSFVPIPGSQQHKRPRRRYEEIERMYKCGWNGCEKAYGTLNHLNAHVTMQGHGPKRTPDEFKEIRKEWKQRKKEEEAQRKAEEERQRQANSAAAAAAAAAIQAPADPTAADGTQPPTTYSGSRALQLPPIGYQASAYPAPPSATVPQQPLPDYSNNSMYPSYPPPHSPYGQPPQSMYSQSNGAQHPSH